MTGAVSAPVASVVIPAHQEEATIGRCLEGLQRSGVFGRCEVVVVANGCTDATAQVAARYGVEVLDLPAGGKQAALDAGDAACSAFPRVYLDADVVLSGDSLDRLLAALDVGGPQLAVPAARYDLRRAEPLVRLYYRTWQRLREVRGDGLGCGVYAVNASGRGRWQQFPADVADDFYVHTRFSSEERVQVPGAFSLVRPPQTLASLLAVRSRVYAGMHRTSADTAALQRPRRRLRPLLTDPPALLGLPVYVVLSLVAKRRAAQQVRSGTAHWARDASGRAP